MDIRDFCLKVHRGMVIHTLAQEETEVQRLPRVCASSRETAQLQRYCEHPTPSHCQEDRQPLAEHSLRPAEDKGFHTFSH